MKIVKLTFPPEKWDIAKHSPNGNCEWGDYKFVLNKDIDECDYWLICGNLVNDNESTIVSQSNVIFDTSESSDIVNYDSDFLNQFNFITSFRTDLKHKNILHTIPIIPWFVKENFDELSVNLNIKKSKKISLLASGKKISINHIKRLNFIKKIHKYFGNEIDIYGAGFTEHIYDKTPTLQPYQFSIVLETITDSEYFSEKLGDCYLSETFPIYYGCNNLNQYFSKKSFVSIDINNIENSINTIKTILNSDNYFEQHLNYLLQSKKLYLNEYSIFPVMANILDRVKAFNLNYSSYPKQKINLKKYKFKRNYLTIKNKVETLGYDFYTKIF